MARNITVTYEVRKSATSSPDNVRVKEGTTLGEFKDLWDIDPHKQDVLINGAQEEDDYELEPGDAIVAITKNYNSGCAVVRA